MSPAVPSPPPRQTLKHSCASCSTHWALRCVPRPTSVLVWLCAHVSALNSAARCPPTTICTQNITLQPSLYPATPLPPAMHFAPSNALPKPKVLSIRATTPASVLCNQQRYLPSRALHPEHYPCSRNLYLAACVFKLCQGKHATMHARLQARKQRNIKYVQARVPNLQVCCAGMQYSMVNSFMTARR